MCFSTLNELLYRFAIISRRPDNGAVLLGHGHDLLLVKMLSRRLVHRCRNALCDGWSYNLHQDSAVDEARNIGRTHMTMRLHIEFQVNHPEYSFLTGFGLRHKVEEDALERPVPADFEVQLIRNRIPCLNAKKSIQ